MQYQFNGKSPVIGETCFVADSATLIGDITLADGCNIWYGAALRADVGPISMGKGSNVQENAVVHLDIDTAVVIGENVTVGHGAIVHGCTVGDNTLIGMGAILLNNCIIGKGCIIGAGALVPEGMVIPDGALAVGVPAKVRGTVSDAQAAAAIANAQHYVTLGQEHKQLVPIY